MRHNQTTEDNFICQSCGYRSGQRLRECPECRKRKVSLFIISEETDSSDGQNGGKTFNKKKVGTVLLDTGIAFFFIAPFVYFGIGTEDGTYTATVAKPGENWLEAFALAVVGLIMIIVGTYLKRQ